MQDPSPERPGSRDGLDPPPKRLHSLRRRVFAAFLVLALVPAGAALAVSWFASVRSVRITARRDAYDTAARLSVAIDEAIMRRVRELAALADNPLVVSEVADFLDEPIAEWSPEDSAPPEEAVYVVDRDGGVLAELTLEGPRLPGAGADWLRESLALQALARELAGGPAILEAPPRPPEGQALLLACPFGEGPTIDDPLALVSVTLVAPILREAETVNREVGQRLAVASRSRGVIYTTLHDQDYEGALNSMRESLFAPAPEPELAEVRVRSIRYGIACQPVHSISRLSLDSPGLPVAEWRVLHAVNLDERFSPIAMTHALLILVGMALAPLAAVLAAWLSGRFIRPIRHIARGMERFAEGDLEHRIDVRTHDELEALAQTANRTAARLRTTLADLADRNRQMEEKAAQLELIHSIGEFVNRALEMDELFDRVLAEIISHVQCDRLGLALTSDDGKSLELAFVHPAENVAFPEGVRIPLEGSIAGQALRERRILVHQVTPDGHAFEDRRLARLGMRSLCIAPLFGAAGPLGTLNLASSQADGFTDFSLEFLDRIIGSVAIAVEHGRLFSRVSRFAEELEATVEERTHELKRAQEKLAQAEKLAATGAIAAHIAHEVNNPLSIIKNYLRILGGRIDQPERAPVGQALSVREELVVIEEEIDRIARIVDQLRHASQPVEPVATHVQLPDEIRRIVELFGAAARSVGVTLRTDLDPALGEVLLCSDTLRQILINLVRNSLDAMEGEGGELVIRAHADAPRAGAFTIEVIDTGCGIPPDDLPNIYDPFFTTKGEGKGTGLGLSISASLAQSMGGRLEAESAVGHGTTMRLILPVEARPPTDARDDTESPFVRRRRGRIIIG